jgi:hypothetical protein
MPSTPRIYATTRRRFSSSELVRLGFRQEGSVWVKRGGCRQMLATASGTGDSFRVTPYARHWR